MPELEPGQLYHSVQTVAGRLVEALQAEVREHAVLTYHAYQVGGYAHDEQVEQRQQRLEVDPMAFAVGLRELEAHAAA